ncbi:MAG: hypothetical protein IKI25_02830 [Bacteroidales bacterium]|nr:hypothetical protein [Bacteroidales bacterium]MBR7034680.1 hypothetical protein [Bacteroidales bacterium]
MSGKYDDIINLPHHVSETHPQMSMRNRAAQFSPFAALSGHSDAIHETARYTDDFQGVDESNVEALNQKIAMILDKINEHPQITVTYFKPDEKKEGGSYTLKTGNIKRVDDYEHVLQFTDNEEIPIQSIFNIDGEMFSIIDNQ